MGEMQEDHGSSRPVTLTDTKGKAFLESQGTQVRPIVLLLCMRLRSKSARSVNCFLYLYIYTYIVFSKCIIILSKANMYCAFI